ncbi:MAG: 6-phosphogluconolactonase [Gaiellales bacterium]
MQHELVVLPDAAAVSKAAAERVATAARDAVAARGVFSLAVSGGRSPWAMFADLAELDMPWEAVEIYQVDERIAPEGDPLRNLTHLRESLGPQLPVQIHPMPVEDADPEAGARAYAGDLPTTIDMIHLGLGPDGHTASLVPGDPILDVDDRLIAVTGGEYQGTHRMSMTYPELAKTRGLLWLITGEDKRGPLQQLLAGDPSIPAGRVTAPTSVILADAAAAG